MKTIYLAGGINGLSDAACKDWREQVKEELAGSFTFLDPMRRDYRGREDECVNELVEGDELDIANSDFVLAYCPKPSWGMAMEIQFAAHELKIPVISITTGRISPWLRKRSTVIVPTVELAIQFFQNLASFELEVA